MSRHMRSTEGALWMRLKPSVNAGNMEAMATIRKKFYPFPFFKFPQANCTVCVYWHFSPIFLKLRRRKRGRDYDRQLQVTHMKLKWSSIRNGLILVLPFNQISIWTWTVKTTQEKPENVAPNHYNQEHNTKCQNGTACIFLHGLSNILIRLMKMCEEQGVCRGFEYTHWHFI